MTWPLNPGATAPAGTERHVLQNGAVLFTRDWGQLQVKRQVGTEVEVEGPHGSLWFGANTRATLERLRGGKVRIDALVGGKVLFQTDLMQLIQYEPATREQYRRPLVIIPPWINKYYILDLRPQNSFIKWATEQGHSVFVLSWVNPDARLAQMGFEDYMLQGPLAALEAVEKATGERKVNFIGYCLGGTLLGATLAWLAAKGQDRVGCATFFVSLLDFTAPGELGVFIDEAQVANLEKRMNELGWYRGKNFELEYFASSVASKTFDVAAEEMVKTGVDLIVTNNSPSTRAAMKATRTIPIVFGAAANPDRAGFIASYAQPGGNVTGLALDQETRPRGTSLVRSSRAAASPAPLRTTGCPALPSSLRPSCCAARRPPLPTTTLIRPS